MIASIYTRSLLLAALLSMTGASFAASTTHELSSLETRARQLVIQINVLNNMLIALRQDLDAALDAQGRAGIQGTQQERDQAEARVNQIRAEIRRIEEELNRARAELEATRAAIEAIRNPPPAPAPPPAPGPGGPPAGAGPPAAAPSPPEHAPASPAAGAGGAAPAPSPSPAAGSPPCGCQEGQTRVFSIRVARVWYPYGSVPGEYFFTLHQRLAGVLSSVDALQRWWLMLEVTQVCRNGSWATTGFRTWFQEIDGDLERARFGRAEELIVTSWTGAADDLVAARDRILREAPAPH